MTNKKLLSIVIPTRNRQKYAIHCINSILTINDERIEVVVHDNSDTDELDFMIKKNKKDNRLIYRYDPTPMSTIHNFNRAMDFVNGEYVCFIGDDDSVNPKIVDVALLAKSKRIDVIIEKTRIEYSWPQNNSCGVLYVYPYRCKIKKINIEIELRRFISEGGVYYLQHDLAKVYHGIVKKECFDKVKNEIGCYFGGLSPDIFSAISISLVAKKIISIDYPFTIAGSSPASNQTHRTDRAKNLELQDAPHFRERGNYTWSEIIPPVYSGETIWAESSIKALEAFKRHDLIKSINRLKLLNHIILASPQHKNAVLKHAYCCNISLSDYLKIHFTKINILIFRIFWKGFKKIKRFLFRQKSRKFKKINNIEHATSIVYETFKDTSYNLLCQNKPSQRNSHF